MPYIVKYSLKRIGLLLATTFIILTVTFFLVKMLPGAAMTGNETAQFAYCQEQVKLGYFLRETSEQANLGDVKLIFNSPDGKVYYFYEKPIVLQYGAWLKGIFTEWNWGLSSAFRPSSSAMNIILER